MIYYTGGGAAAGFVSSSDPHVIMNYITGVLQHVNRSVGGHGVTVTTMHNIGLEYSHVGIGLLADL